MTRSKAADAAVATGCRRTAAVMSDCLLFEVKKRRSMARHLFHQLTRQRSHLARRRAAPASVKRSYPLTIATSINLEYLMHANE